MVFPLIQPTTVFNFMVNMWDVQGPTVLGIDTAHPAAAAAGAVANLASQALLGAFSEVSGLDAETDVETYDEGGRNYSPHRFYTRAKFQNLTLKRGITPNPDLWDWHHQVAYAQQSTRIRKSGIIILFDRGGVPVGVPLPANLGRIPVAAWYFERGLPVRMQGPSLDAKRNEIAIETLEIAHEGIRRVSPAMIPGMGDLSAAFGGLVGAAVGGAVAGVAAGVAAL